MSKANNTPYYAYLGGINPLDHVTDFSIEPIKLMSPTIFLFVLLFYAVLLSWCLKKFKFSNISTILLCVITVIFISFFIPMFFEHAIIRPDPSEAFASIEYTERNINTGWLVRYLLEVSTFFLGLIYFWSCWLFAWYFFVKRKQKNNKSIK